MDEMKTNTMTQAPPAAEQRTPPPPASGAPPPAENKAPRSRVVRILLIVGVVIRRARDLEDIFRHAESAGQHHRAQRAH